MHLQTEQLGAAQTERCPTLVLGLGNILLRDEGVGVRVIEAMDHLALPPHVELFDGATAGLDLLDVLADRRRVIVVDAIDGAYEPGTVVRLGSEDLAPSACPNVSMHEVGFTEALTAARHLGVEPEEVVVIGVAPHDLRSGLELSPDIARILPKIIALVLMEME